LDCSNYITSTCEATSGRNRSWKDGLQKCSIRESRRHYQSTRAPKEKSQDFSAEVTAQTSAKPVTTPLKEEPAATEAKETEPK